MSERRDGRPDGRDAGNGEQVQPRVNGQPYHCSCGANVFTRRGRIYRCNGCDAEYVGDGEG